MIEFKVGQVLSVQGISAAQRVLRVTPTNDEIVAISIGSKRSSTVHYSFSDWHDHWMAGGIKEIDDPLPVQEIPETEKSIKTRDERWNAIKPLVEDERIFNTAYRKKAIKKRSQEINTGANAISNWIVLYFQGNFSKNVLLGFRHKCGGKGKRRTESAESCDGTPTPKRGRPNRLTSGGGLNVTSRIRALIMAAIRKHFYVSAETTILHAYYMLLLESFKDALTLDTHGDIVAIDYNRAISYQQMRHWYSIDGNAEEESRKKYGVKQHNLKRRPLPGNARDEAESPGYRAQIDSTPMDINLVARWSRHAHIGRPTIYFIVDVVSAMIGGYYITLTGPTTDAAARTLLNACEDKVKLCQEYGINITRQQWPTMGVPLQLAADRGTDNMALMRKFAALGGHEVPAPYRADLRPIVERVNRSSSESLTQIPGLISKDAGKRGVADSRFQAVWNLTDLHRHVLLWIIEQNNRVIRDYPLNSRMVDDGIPPVPSKMWQWGIATLRGQRVVLQQLLDSVLLERMRDVPIQMGILLFLERKYQPVVEQADSNLKDLLYISKTGEVLFDPGCLDVVFLCHPTQYGKFIKCDLIAKKNRDRKFSQADLIALQTRHQNNIEAERKLADAHRLNTKAKAAQSVAEATKEKATEGPDSRSKNQKRQDLAKARALEKSREELAKKLNMVASSIVDESKTPVNASTLTPTSAQDEEDEDDEIEPTRAGKRYARPLLHRKPSSFE